MLKIEIEDSRKAELIDAIFNGRPLSPSGEKYSISELINIASMAQIAATLELEGREPTFDEDLDLDTVTEREVIHATLVCRGVLCYYDLTEANVFNFTLDWPEEAVRPNVDFGS